MESRVPRPEGEPPQAGDGGPAPAPPTRRPDGPPAEPRARQVGPSMLDLVRLSPETIFPPGGEPLYRQIARLTELAEGQEVVDVGSGRGVAARFLASAYGAEVTGIDPDAQLVYAADRYAREHAELARLSYQASPLDDLPFKDGIFDVAIGEIALAGCRDPERAVHELVRVTRPRGAVVLIQLIWTGNLDAGQRGLLVEHLGAEPRLLVEWKQLLRDAGVVDLVVEDWSDEPSPFRPVTGRPFHDLAETFSLRQKLAILRRALQRWGWRGVRGAILREQEIQRLLTRERVLGLSLIKGIKWAEA